LQKKHLISILASDEQKQEVLKTAPDETRIRWVATLEALIAEEADAYIDLQFEPSAERVSLLKKCLPATVMIHSVEHTLAALDVPFIRVNAWPGFLERPLIECASATPGNEEKIENTCSILKRESVLLPDEPGFISARILAMIINEAYFALQEAVSSRRDIDLAMRTGTNYPYGPFEWGDKIGLKKIVALLSQLALTDSRYQPCGLLLAEANTANSNDT
jgi:3-hydroxybutyryl-CoA dehydrogenase